MKKTVASIFLLAFVFINTYGQDIQKKVYTSTRTNTAPQVDGIPGDEAWDQGEWAGEFIQFEPYEGKEASQPTEFKILYDDNSIYVAIKAYDSAPDSIINRMTRRDQVDGDYVGVSFDSYHDLRTGFTFILSSTGVKMDILHANDGMVEDASWDPIWHARASIQDWGWYAEIKIPFTQLRFEKNTDDVWGMEVFRLNYRESEMSFWQPIPRNTSGLVHMYGELDGLDGIEPKKTFDLMPYAVASYENYKAQEGNPFLTGSDFIPNGGLDGKLGLTNNLTLDFTINPDFGQVEADPSQVNLTAYESFFREKRPFFIEGNNITRLSVGIGDSEMGNDNLFYSRRIGKSPSGYTRLENGEYSKTPRNVRILGAAKLTGKTSDGLSIGLIESVTPRTFARIDSAGRRSTQEVEPLTNYFIGRVQKDFNKGNTMIGGMLTHTYRDLELVEDLENSPLNYLHSSALTGGIDFTQHFNDKNWKLAINTAFSQVKGSEEAISATQMSARHLMHRPDAGHIDYDPTRTSLSGTGGKMEFGKIGGNWNFMLFSTFKSPGFEINDLGYLRAADDMMHALWSAYSINEPRGIYRRIRFNANWFSMWDYGFNFKQHGANMSVFTQFKNFWNASIGLNYNSRGISTTMLRGGPNIKTPGGKGMYYNLNSDNRKKLRISLSGNHFWGREEYMQRNSATLFISYRPFNTLSLSLTPSYTSTVNALQYVSLMKNEEGENAYIFADLVQKVLSMSLRINYNITPDLTIQYWGQPFFAAADYSGFKKITEAMAESYDDRYHVFSGDQINKLDKVYYIDEDADGNTDYSFRDPSFNFDEFLSNLVLRWEFAPGSTLYAVWSQTRDAYLPTGAFVLKDNINTLFNEEKPYNVFLLKFSYRFALR
ncbi:MAG: carbohydrate binding family 9 domain-containing protein [Bacteroidales bacterium]|nr:carbohydrate binding family 9 domain-containing protein [Bacteroidales bacterium]